jgi:hypothetical protein
MSNMSNPYGIKLCCYWELIGNLKNVIENMWGTHWEDGGNISVESSYRKYTGSVDWANYIS